MWANCCPRDQQRKTKPSKQRYFIWGYEWGSGNRAVRVPQFSGKPLGEAALVLLEALPSSGGFPSGAVIKNLSANAGELGLIPGLGRSPGEENGNPFQYVCLENPMDRGTWWATVHGVIKSWTQLSYWAHTHTYTHTHTHTKLQSFLYPPVGPRLGNSPKTKHW